MHINQQAAPHVSAPTKPRPQKFRLRMQPDAVSLNFMTLLTHILLFLFCLIQEMTCMKVIYYRD